MIESIFTAARFFCFPLISPAVTLVSLLCRWARRNDTCNMPSKYLFKYLFSIFENERDLFPCKCHNSCHSLNCHFPRKMPKMLQDPYPSPVWSTTKRATGKQSNTPVRMEDGPNIVENVKSAQGVHVGIGRSRLTGPLNEPRMTLPAGMTY